MSCKLLRIKIIAVSGLTAAICYFLCANSRQMGEATTCSQTPELYSVDVNGDGAIDVSDAVYLLRWIFEGAEAPRTCFAQASEDVIERLVALEGAVSSLEQSLSALEEKLEHVNVAGQTIVFDGVNVQIVNGSGSTTHRNGLGNLIVGYQESRTNDNPPGVDERSGSHNIVVGTRNNYSNAAGGIVAGHTNTISHVYACALGGSRNTVSGWGAASIGGRGNNVQGNYSTACSGLSNVVSGGYAFAAGGEENTADGMFSFSSGGKHNLSAGDYSIVSGGEGNTSSADYATVIGGALNRAEENGSFVAGGRENTASGASSSVCGGRRNTATGNYSSVSGGRDRSAPGDDDWRGGSLLEDN